MNRSTESTCGLGLFDVRVRDNVRHRALLIKCNGRYDASHHASIRAHVFHYSGIYVLCGNHFTTMYNKVFS